MYPSVSDYNDAIQAKFVSAVTRPAKGEWPLWVHWRTFSPVRELVRFVPIVLQNDSEFSATQF